MTLKHVHKYQRFQVGKKKNPTFRCMLGGCTHMITSKELMPGRTTVCWGCGDDFVMDWRHTDIRKPLCDICREARKLRRELEGKTA